MFGAIRRVHDPIGRIEISQQTNGSGAERYNPPRPPDALPETDLMRRSGLGTCGLPFAADRAIVRSG
jgi:hypothetical protein